MDISSSAAIIFGNIKIYKYLDVAVILLSAPAPRDKLGFEVNWDLVGAGLGTRARQLKNSMTLILLSATK